VSFNRIYLVETVSELHRDRIGPHRDHNVHFNLSRRSDAMYETASLTLTLSVLILALTDPNPETNAL
jgi:hypothetical protein